ncbi:MAG: hypothetical protein ACE5DY_02930 [Mariprofundaceae bacterium]
MKWTQLRGLLFAVAALVLAIVTFLFWRLDAELLGQHFSEQLGHAVQRQVKIGEVSFSLAHGPGLSIRDFRIIQGVGDSWGLSARQVDGSLELIPLLMGELRFQKIFILSPDIFLTSVPETALFKLPPDLKLERLSLRNGSLQLTDVGQRLDHILLDVRGLSQNIESRWEMKARFGDKTLQSDGRASIRNSAISTAFGKFKTDALPVSTFTNKEIPNWLRRHMLSTTLTFNMNVRGQWQLFGDLSLNNTEEETPAIRLRGKIEGDSTTGRLSWHDSFMHIGRKTVVASSGERDAGGSYNFTATSREGRLEDMIAATGMDIPLKGILNLESKLTWSDGTLRGDGKLDWLSTAWSGTPVPNIIATFEGLQFNSRGLLKIQTIEAKQGKKNGTLRLGSIKHDTGGWSVSVRIKEMEDWWVEVANTASAFTGFKPFWKGGGVLSGSAEISKSMGALRVSAQWNADHASLTYASVFSKPEKVPASGSILFEDKGGSRALEIADFQLGSSSIKNASWQHKKGEQHIRVEAMDLDFPEAKRFKLGLPDALTDLHGKIRGSFGINTKSTQPFLSENWQSWLPGADAILYLKDFGPHEHFWNGTLRLQQGRASSPRLHWQHQQQEASLSGSVSLIPLAGEVHIRDAIFPEGDISFPDWLKMADLSGSFAGKQLAWGGNAFREISGNYRLKSGRLKLRKTLASLARGKISSDLLQLDLNHSPVLFSGPLLIKGINLDELRFRDTDRLINGILYATTTIHGALPISRWRQWEGVGEIEIRDGKLAGTNLYGHLSSLIGLPHRSNHKETLFSRLNARFELRDNTFLFSRLLLDSPVFSAHGKGSINSDNSVDAHLDIQFLQGDMAKETTSPKNGIRIPVHVSGTLPEVSLRIVK